LIEAHQARLWLAQGKLEPATHWAREYQRLGKTEYLREFEELTVARVLLAQDKPAEALAVLDRLLPPAGAAGRMGMVIEILALRPWLSRRWPTWTKHWRHCNGRSSWPNRKGMRAYLLTKGAHGAPVAQGSPRWQYTQLRRPAPHRPGSRTHRSAGD